MANLFTVTPNEVIQRDTVERISINEFTPKQFIDSYEKVYKPVVITDAQNSWLAREKWTLEVT